MFQELPVQERCEAAARCGFKAVEFLSPYPFQIEDISNWLKETGTRLILINIDPGDSGEVGTAALPGREDAFRQRFNQALDYAASLSVPMIHVLAGRPTDTQSISKPLFIENVRWAAEKAQKHDITLNLEPLNDQDVPGYLHSKSDETVSLMSAIDRTNVRLQFDFYHLQITEGNLGSALSKHLGDISHVQFSSVPGRHEPQYGEINVDHLFKHLDDLGYKGWVGCEYWPKENTGKGLAWAERYGITPEV